MCKWMVVRNGSNNDRAVAWCHVMKVVSRLDLWNIILSMVVCGNCFAEPDTILAFKIFYGVFGGGTRLPMSKTILRVGLIVIEAWFRGY